MPTIAQAAFIGLINLVKLAEGWSVWSGSQACNPWAGVNEKQFRLPPTLDTSLDTAWVEPPSGFTLGNWKVRYSSRLVYTHFYNFEGDFYPAFPMNDSFPGRNVDLSTFQFAPTGNATIDNAVVKVFGYDYPQTEIAPYVFQWRGEGTQSETVNSWELVAWGYDRNDVPWRAEYETMYTTATQYGEACIDIDSRTEDGPDPITYQAILDTFRKLYASNSDMLSIIANTTELPRDGRRAGKPPASCDAACMLNAGPLPGSG